MKNVISAIFCVTSACVATAAPAYQEETALLRKFCTAAAKALNAEYKQVGWPTFKLADIRKALVVSYKTPEEWAALQAECGKVGSYMHYSGKDLQVSVNTERLQALLRATERTPEVERETLLLLMESAAILGEYQLSSAWYGLRDYWRCVTETSRKKKAVHASHLQDAEGRVNPLTVYGAYCAYLVSRHCYGEGIGFYDWLKTVAATEEYKHFVEETIAHYPEYFIRSNPVEEEQEKNLNLDAENGLMTMLRFENQWLQIWLLYLKNNDIQDATSEDYREYRETIRQYMETALENHPHLSAAAISYVKNKYPIIINAEPEDEKEDSLPHETENTENAIASEEAKVSPEEAKRQAEADARRCVEAHGIYYRLLNKKRVWDNLISGEYIDPEAVQLVNYLIAEELKMFAEHVRMFLYVSLKIKDKKTADTYAPYLALILQEMDKCAEAVLLLGTEFQGKIEGTCFNEIARPIMAPALVNFRYAEEHIKNMKQPNSEWFWRSSKLKRVYYSCGECGPGRKAVEFMLLMSIGEAFIE